MKSGSSLGPLAAVLGGEIFAAMILEVEWSEVPERMKFELHFISRNFGDRHHRIKMKMACSKSCTLAGHPMDHHRTFQAYGRELGRIM